MDRLYEPLPWLPRCRLKYLPRYQVYGIAVVAEFYLDILDVLGLKASRPEVESFLGN